MVCEIEDEKEQPLIEVIEGDGYNENKKVTYDDLVIHTQKLMEF